MNDVRSTDHLKPIRPAASLLAAGLLASVLSGCGGGVTVSEDPPTPPEDGVRSVAGEALEPGNPENPESWETDEYNRSNSLALINASHGYAARTTGRAGGSGIAVAVLDNGVDFSHPDLAPSELDKQYLPRGVAAKDHGTPVASVIAARRNGSGVHGVAYNANLVSIGTCGAQDGCYGAPGLFAGEPEQTAADILSAAGLKGTAGNILGGSIGGVRSIPEASSHIMNMSFGYTGNVPVIRDAMRHAAGQGRIMVAALGNESRTGPTGAPATHVADPGIAGLAIAVGSLNSNGASAASHSNWCGYVRQYCMFAPGENVAAATAGGGHEYVSGTSFAAPHVAGAAAVVWAAFPNKSGAQIVSRLLSTARPLDGREVSEVYGHGALDLGAALTPAGFLSVPVGGATMTRLASTSVSLPMGFAPPSGASGLEDAVVYDEQMFPFLHDLTTNFRTANTHYGDRALEDFMSSLGGLSSLSLPGEKVSVTFAHEEDDPFAARAGFAPWDGDGEEVHDYRMHFELSPNLGLAIGRGFNTIGASNGFVARRTNGTLFGNEHTVGPFAALAGRGLGLGLDWKLDEDTVLDFAGEEGDGYFGGSSARLVSLGVTRRVNDHVTFGARYGMLHEDGSRMGVLATGAFAGASGAATDFLDLSVEGRFSDTVAMFGTFSHGRTGAGAPADASLVSAWSDTRAESFLVGAEFRQLLRDEDRFTITVSSPFRADRATLHVDVPDHEVADAVVRYSRRDVDLTPDGREHRLEFMYDTGPGIGGYDRATLAFGGYVREEPNHDAQAKTDYGAAAKLRIRF